MAQAGRLHGMTIRISRLSAHSGIIWTLIYPANSESLGHLYEANNAQLKREATSRNKPGTSHNGCYVKQLMVEFDTPYPRSIGGDLGIRSDQPQPLDLGPCDQDTVEQIVLWGKSQSASVVQRPAAFPHSVIEHVSHLDTSIT